MKEFAVSDVPSHSTPELLLNGGWLATAILAAWGWVTRVALGRHFRQMDELTKSLANIDKRMARLEGRFEQQDAER